MISGPENKELPQRKQSGSDFGLNRVNHVQYLFTHFGTQLRIRRDRRDHAQHPFM